MNSLSQNSISKTFMSETDKHNPFGPNYYLLPYNVKVYYKFTKIKKYVHYTPDDQRIIAKENIIFASGVLISGAIAALLGQFIKNRYLIRVYELLNDGHVFYYFAVSALSAKIFYQKYYEYFIKNVCIPFNIKYENDAIKNGFESWKISETKD